MKPVAEDGKLDL